MAIKKEKEEKSEKPSKGNKTIIIVLFILGLLVLGGAVFGGVYLFMKTNQSVSAQEIVIENTYSDLSEFTINLADEGGKRYFKGEITLGYDKKNSKIAEEIKANDAVVRDAVIFYFKGQKADYINNVNNKEAIKKQLMEAINKELQKGKLTDIRFKSMIVQ